MSKVFKDMFGRGINVGDMVLHLWTYVDGRGRPYGGKNGVNHKLGTVIRLNPKSIRIRHRDKGEEGESNIYNTTNRIIIMENESFYVRKEGFINEALKKHTEVLEKEVGKCSRLRSRNKKLREVIKEKDRKIAELNKCSRFDLIDFED